MSQPDNGISEKSNPGQPPPQPLQPIQPNRVPVFLLSQFNPNIPRTTPGQILVNMQNSSVSHSLVPNLSNPVNTMRMQPITNPLNMMTNPLNTIRIQSLQTRVQPLQVSRMQHLQTSRIIQPSNMIMNNRMPPAVTMHNSTLIHPNTTTNIITAPTAKINSAQPLLTAKTGPTSKISSAPEKRPKAPTGKRKKTTPPSTSSAESSEPTKKKRAPQKRKPAAPKPPKPPPEVKECKSCHHKVLPQSEISCQTESFKFITQTGTRVPQEIPKIKIASDFSTSLRTILRNLKDTHFAESGTSFDNSRNKIAEQFAEWFQIKCPKHLTKCPLCSEDLTTNDKLRRHVVNFCPGLETMNRDMMSGYRTPDFRPNSVVDVVSEKLPDQEVVAMFQKEYFRMNDDLNLKDTCIFCGVQIEEDERRTEFNSLRIDEHHFFNGCVVFQCFLSLLDTPQIKSITHVIGTTNTFLYFKNMIVFFAIGFKHQIYDPGFLREDRFYLIGGMMKQAANSIMSHDTCCIFCSVQLKSLCVLEHHLSYCLCPVLKNFYLMIKQCLDTKSAITTHMRRISVFYQAVLRDNTLPIFPKQSILDQKLCKELLDNAMYFRSLDPNFTLQSYKSPKDYVVAQKIEKIQQAWAEKVVTDRDVECPFCLNSFASGKTLLRHIMFISCKNMKSVCNGIYMIMDYSEWNVDDNPLLQQITFILRNQLLQGKLDVILSRDQLKELLVSVVYFLEQDPSEYMKEKLFSGSTSSSTTEEQVVHSDGLGQLVSWAKKLVKKKNVTALCSLCGQDEVTYTSIVPHIVMGKCGYTNQILPIILDCYTDSKTTDKTPIKMTSAFCHTQHSLLVDHLRRLLWLYNVNCKPAQFFVQSEFEVALLTPGSPLNACYSNHQSFIRTLFSPNQTTCDYCSTEFSSNDILLSHLSLVECATFQFILKHVKKEFDLSQTLNIPIGKIPELIKIHSEIFKVDPGVVFSSQYLQAKTALGTIQSESLVDNLKKFMNWTENMFENSICVGCKGSFDPTSQQTHILLEESEASFCPDMRKFLDFHKQLICKKDNNSGVIKATFTLSDMLDLKMYFQQFSVAIEHDQHTRYQTIPDIISPDLKTQLSASIGSIVKAFPEFKGVYPTSIPEESKALFHELISKQMLISGKLVLTPECLLCMVQCQNVEDVSHHLSMFECPVLLMMIKEHSLDKADNTSLDTYKQLVEEIKITYPKLSEINVISVFKSLHSKHAIKLRKYILSTLPGTNPYECKFCSEDFCSKGEIYTHYKKLQCSAQKECLSFIPNKKPQSFDHPFINVMCDLLFSVFNNLHTKDVPQIRRYLNDVNSHADLFDFWCSNFTNTLIPTCVFCKVSLLSVNIIKSHAKVCPVLRGVNEEVFGKEKVHAEMLLQKKGLGSCRTSGALPAEVLSQEEGMPFMQRHQCSKYLGWVPLCMDCVSHTEDEEVEDTDGGTCRFLLFRRLMKRDGILSVFDFECSKTASSLSNWVPSNTPLPELDADSAKYLLSHLLPHFNKIMATELWELENANNLRLKHQVKNVRELCDSCDTTLFNIHLFCPRCGYVICMECYKDRLSGTVKAGLADCSDGSSHEITTLDTCVTIPPQAVKDLCSAVKSVKSNHNINIVNIPYGEQFSMHSVPHDFICDDQVLVLYDPENAGNVNLFQNFFQKGNAVVVQEITKNLTSNLWRPETFSRHFGNDRELVVNCSTLEIHRILLKEFWDGFEDVSERLRNDNGDPMVLKLKDWPTTHDFKEKLPLWFDEFMSILPLKSYTWRSGLYNIARYLPDIYCLPDLGPKMYIAYSNANNPNEGSTVLHIDISDACNIIMYVGESQDVLINYSDEPPANSGSTHYLERKEYTLREICEDTDDKQIKRIQRNKSKIGALWHLFHPNDIDKIRHFIRKVFKERGQELPVGHDPIHDQTCYIDQALRARLLKVFLLNRIAAVELLKDHQSTKEYGVKGWAIAQCEGDVVFIPAGAPHQVRNIQSCIKIAEDYVSPERVGFCLKYTEEIRHLTKSHHNHEDKLQVKNLLYHAVKECTTVLQSTPSTCTEPPTTSRTTISSQTTPHKNDKPSEQQTLLDKQEAHLVKLRKSYEAILAENKDIKKAMKVEKEELNLLRAAQRPPSQSSQLLQTPPARSNNQPVPHAPNRGAPRSSETPPPKRKSLTSLQTSSSKNGSSSSLIVRPHSSSSLKNRSPLDPYRLQGRQYPQIQRSKPEPNSRDPRLIKLKPVIKPVSLPSSSSVPGSSNGRLTPSTPEKVIPKSAFQGVQQHVQALRKNQNPRVPKTPETPEPMDTNTDSCSPIVPDNLYRERNKNLSREIQILQRGESSQLYHPKEFQVYNNLICDPRSRFQLNPPQQSTTEAASNSETDSNEEPIITFGQGANFVRYNSQSPATDQYITKHDSCKTADSPNYHNKSVNLMISSPKQPVLMSSKEAVLLSKDLQKRKESSTSLFDDVRNVMKHVNIKEEVKTPPNKSPLPLPAVYNVQIVTPVATPDSTPTPSTVSPVTPLSLSPATRSQSTPHTSPAPPPLTTSPISPPETPTNNGTDLLSQHSVPSPCTPTTRIQQSTPLLYHVPQDPPSAPSTPGVTRAPTLVHPSPALQSLSSISSDDSSSNSDHPSPASRKNLTVPGGGNCSKTDVIGHYIKSHNMNSCDTDITAESSQAGKTPNNQNLSAFSEDTGPLIFDSRLRGKIKSKDPNQ